MYKMKKGVTRSTLLSLLAVLSIILTTCVPVQETAPAPEEVPEEPIAAEATEEIPEEPIAAETVEETPEESEKTALIGTFDEFPFGCSECFNPHTAKTRFTWFEQYFSTLYRFDTASELPVPYLAEDWEINDDFTEYTVLLREDVLWHDMIPLTADDVAFTLELVLNPEYNSIFANYAQSISDIEIIDDLTVTITLSTPNTDFMNHPLSEIFIVPQHALGGISPADLANHEWWTTNPIGTGPFQWQEYIPNESVELVAFEDYFLSPNPCQTDRLIKRSIGDPDEALAALLSGEIDFTYVPEDRLDLVQNQPNITVIEGPSPVTLAVFNDRVDEECQAQLVQSRPIVVGEPLAEAVEEEFIERIRESEIISPDLVDLESATGLAFEGEFFEVIGAVTEEPVPIEEGLVISVMFIEESENAIYPSGLYLVVHLNESQENPELLLIDQNGEAVPPLDVRAESQQRLGVSADESKFVITLGSHRCSACPPWWPYYCPCWNCYR